MEATTLSSLPSLIQQLLLPQIKFSSSKTYLDWGQTRTSALFRADPDRYPASSIGSAATVTGGCSSFSNTHFPRAQSACDVFLSHQLLLWMAVNCREDALCSWTVWELIRWYDGVAALVIRHLTANAALPSWDLSS